MNRRIGDHTLTAKQQQAIDLYTQGLTYREIAHQMGISYGMTEKHLRAARRHLRGAEQRRRYMELAHQRDAAAIVAPLRGRAVG